MTITRQPAGTRRGLTGRFDFIPQDAVLFGPGTISSLAAECERMAIGRLFVVMSPSVARQVDVEATFDRATDGRVVAVFTGGRPHVPHEVVLQAVEAARAANVDGVLSVGGGSQTDLAKAVRLCLAENIASCDELLRWRVQFEYPDKLHVLASSQPQLPQIAVGTTLSASEFTSLFGVTDSGRKVKDLYTAPASVPRLAILDAELAAFTPRDLWASTGVRAVDHAVETLCSITAQPFTDALCADALRRLTRYLPLSVRNANDRDAAGQCQIAAWQSIFGLANVNLGLSHGIGHQLGGKCGVPHGLTSCVMLPSVLEFNLDHTRGPQRLIAEILSEAAGVTVDPHLGAGALMRQFIASLGLPTRLRDVRVQRSDFPALAHDAMTDRIVASNPRVLTGEADVISVLERAW